jgi:hypothetical protein
MSEVLPDLTANLARAVETTRERIAIEMGLASAWVQWVRAGAPNPNGCIVCGSVAKCEFHHVAGKFNSELTIPVCVSCHLKLSERQNGWDPRWQLETNAPALKESLLLRGLSDLCEERARFRGSAYHEVGKRLRANYAAAARSTI